MSHMQGQDWDRVVIRKNKSKPKTARERERERASGALTVEKKCEFVMFFMCKDGP